MIETRWIRRCCVAAAFVMSVLPGSLPAQQQGNIRSVLFAQLKPDRVDDWKAAVKDFAALEKKAGVDQGFTVWASQSGQDQYAVVWYSAKWKELDQDQDPKTKTVAADIAHVIARLNSSTVSMQTWVDEMQPDLHIGGKEMPKMVRTGRIRTATNKMDDVLAIFRSDTFPAMKKAGVSDYGVALARYGTPTNEIHTYSSFNGWGDLDEPYGAQKAMGAEGYKAYLAKLQPYLESVEWTMWRFQPELSYVPEVKP